MHDLAIFFLFQNEKTLHLFHGDFNSDELNFRRTEFTS